ncbi:PQQ-dependent sugar dehydrogenase [Spirosoma endophyticum]|uniref:Por secretion system C-terminal sorting domain-containing protein n=1 Tax=Spirosoma endophyticum TaxID=662367 RepID=A0A1I2F2P8_9BACT|nr:PQQ-dependent sugar dehydrogenase [Spirosoma endophyticum]SFE98988.1 Por secretion system C-terminal sorting domain-containing protein [Spirosoma endophyticum]
MNYFSLVYSPGKVTLLLIWLCLLHYQLAVAQTFPSNFAGVQIATGLDPVGMDVAPDGRVFLAEKNGKVRIVKNNTLLATPFVTIPNVDNFNERGLLKVLLDPNFNTNGFLYVYYTYKAAGSSVSNNRVSRFTASGDVAVAGSERVLIDIDPLGSVGYHNGGGLAVKDGKLFISVGENTVASNAQSLTTLKGKILRINLDGSIPTDNPFYTTATGVNRAIWALGLRNPFRLAAQPGTGKLFVNDVGNSSWEEINEGGAGKNYGWPGIEGVRTNQSPPTNYQDPFYAYDHGQGCSITAGAFYNPTTAKFPAAYVGKYFFGDYCNGWIKTIDPATKAVTNFASGINRPLDVAVANDGTLYFIARGGIAGGSDEANTSSTNGVLWRVDYTGNGVPVIAVQPTSKTVSVGQSVTFTTVASGNPTPTYQWQRNGVSISGATSVSYTVASPVLADNGATFRVVVSNAAGSATSNEVTLTVITNQLPVATISTPATGTKYAAGDVISFSGTGTDGEDGNLPASAFTWKIDLYHFDSPAHAHPAMEPVSGIRSGSFTIPTEMETSANVLFRLFLTVKDSRGATTTVSRDVVPITSTITLTTNPAGLALKLDGSAVTGPYSFSGVSRIVRSLEAVTPQTVGGVTYTFSSWSNGGTRLQNLSTPGVNTTLTANFVPSTGGSTGIVAGGVYELEPQSALGKRLDVRALSTADQAIVELYQSNGGPNQRWKFIARGNGLYELEPQHAPGKRLDVAGRSAGDNIKVQTYTSNGGSNQVWKLIDLGGNIYGLEPQCAPGNRLDIGLVDGVSRAVSKIATGSTSQRWKLIAISASRLGADPGIESDALFAATPNPFTTETTITFNRPVNSQQVIVQIHSVQGQLIRLIDVSTNTEGRIQVNRKGMAAGVYVYSLLVDGVVVVSKRLVVN